MRVKPHLTRYGKTLVPHCRIQIHLSMPNEKPEYVGATLILNPEEIADGAQGLMKRVEEAIA